MTKQQTDRVSQLYTSEVRSWMLITLILGLLMAFASTAYADPYPPTPTNGAAHFPPVAWPTAPADPTTCGTACGGWTAYTTSGATINDQRIQDPSNGGTSPQNYVNVSSGCIDTSLPSVYYSYNAAQQMIFFRWRVEQIANTYGTGPSAGSFSTGDAWNSALWTVLIDIDGDGFREFAVHLDGSSGRPSASIDRLFGIYGNTSSQSIDYPADPNIFLLNHNPTAFVDTATNQIFNYQSSLTPVSNWPKGSNETVWDYGTTRSTLIPGSCKEYFVDYQIPIAMLDASSVGGPTVTGDTPIAFLFTTSNSLNNPLQKDVVLNGDFVGDPNAPAPFGDTITLNGGTVPQPLVDGIVAAGCAPASLSAVVKDAVTTSGAITVAAVDFYYYYDANANSQPDDGSLWTFASAATYAGSSTWTSSWNSSTLPKGQFLIGVKATDAQGNITWSHLTQAQVNTIGPTPPNYTNLAPVPGISYGTFLNSCGVSPTITKAVNPSEVTIGQNVTVTLTVNNPTPSAITISDITDSLPVGFSYQSTVGGTLVATTQPTANATGAAVWTFSPAATIAASGSGTLIFTIKAPLIAGTYSNLASATTSLGAVNSEPVQIGVGAPRLNLSKQASTNSAAPGDTIVYTIRYGNDSPLTIPNVVDHISI